MLGLLLLTACAVAEPSQPVAEPMFSSPAASPRPTAAAATPTPTSDSVPSPRDLAYSLDCGPLDQVRCLEAAAKLVEANEAQTGRRVVSVEFMTACGSFSIVFEGGSVVGADIDCVPGPSATG